MNDLMHVLARACEELGLQVKFDVVLTLAGKSRVVALAHIPWLGASNGMLIFRTYEEVRLHAEELILAQYGYCVLDEPRPDENFDLESFKEMFADWGWCGDVRSKPSWML